MEFQKIVNLLDMTSDDNDLPRFVTKNEFMMSLWSISKKLQC